MLLRSAALLYTYIVNQPLNISIMYRIVVLDTRSTQENPIKPIELVVSSGNLTACINKHVTADTYCVVSHVERFD